MTNRRGRPKSAEKRKSISQAAAELFLREGFDRCSMDSIAAAAGVSKQTVYSHFANKDELFRSCITSKAELYDLRIDPALHTSLDSGLRSFADGFLRLISDPQAVKMWRLMMSEADTHPHVAAMFDETGPDDSLRSLQRFLASHGDRLQTKDYEAMARTFLALAADTWHTRILLGVIQRVEDDERRRHVERIVRQFGTLFGNPDG
ncbi:MAG: TetR/AcrR family transcriptional regulator [Pseudomonadota bacterium]